MVIAWQSIKAGHIMSTYFLHTIDFRAILIHALFNT